MGVEGVVGVAVPQAVNAPVVGVVGVGVGFVVRLDGLAGFGGVGGRVRGMGGVDGADWVSKWVVVIGLVVAAGCVGVGRQALGRRRPALRQPGSIG